MKIKFLKRILAAIVAASTVAITPGFSSAILPESKAYIQSIEGKKLSSGELNEVINRLKEISKEDDEAKAEVAGAIGNMARKGLLYLCSREHFLQLIDIWTECVRDEDARPNVARDISLMTYHYPFFSYYL